MQLPFAIAIFLLLASALTIAISLFLKWRRDRKINPERPVSNWICTIQSEHSTLPYHSDSFPVYLGEDRALSSLERTELEDEAASLAMFCAYEQLSRLKSTDVIAVAHEHYGAFVFLPDFEQGHLIGVKLPEPKAVAAA